MMNSSVWYMYSFVCVWQFEYTHARAHTQVEERDGVDITCQHMDRQRHITAMQVCVTNVSVAVFHIMPVAVQVGCVRARAQRQHA